MIVRPQPDVVRIAREIGPGSLALILYALTVDVLYSGLEWGWLFLAGLPLPLMGTAVALIVTIRNRAAYDRWWEARKLWGYVVNNSRSFSRALITLCPDKELTNTLVHYQVAYVYSLRCFLLSEPPDKDTLKHLPPDIAGRLPGNANHPAAIQFEIGRILGAAHRRGVMDSIAAAQIDYWLGQLIDAHGGLERIKTTPLPRQYSQVPLVFTYLYCLVLPLGLIGQIGWASSIVAAVIGVMFLALDQVGSDLENPFAGSVHDVAMRAVAQEIEINLLRSIGTEDLPTKNPPVDGVLL